MKKTKAKRCPQCKGLGIIRFLHGNLNESGNKIEVSSEGYTLCSRCRGIGIVGIPELDSLTPQQLSVIAQGRTPEELFIMFNHKTPEEIKKIISVFFG